MRRAVSWLNPAHHSGAGRETLEGQWWQAAVLGNCEESDEPSTATTLLPTGRPTACGNEKTKQENAHC